ncbi:MAG TPA: BON domain-containing protein [Methylophilaceae bacterium]|nr:BON domain-containing protein [Methylotenera sp.]HSH73380.1 BON domain-containing protein [Methylophilaceae bacterium]
MTHTKNTFKLSALILALGLSTVALQANAFGDADSMNEGPYTKEFKALDTDNDGTLTYSEAKKEKVFAKGIRKADLDNDKTLDEKEYSDYKGSVQNKNAKRVVSDSVITTKTKAELLKDEGFKSLKVSVETHQGVVLLSGFVETEAQVKQAEEIAAGIEGVKSVKNSLLVKKS